MTFLTYSSSIYTMIDELVNQLVIADSDHFAKVSVGSNTNKACVHWTGNSEDRYIEFKAWKYTTAAIYYAGTSYTPYIIQVVIGNSWNSTSYEVETSVQNYYAVLYLTATTSLETTLFSTRVYSHKIWLDANGFYWNCWNPYSDYTATGFLMNISFLPATGKEYDDGASGIVVQIIHGNAGTSTTNGAYVPSITSGYALYNSTGVIFKSGQYGVVQSEYPLFDYAHCENAFKSVGNNKIYFDFAQLHKNPNTYNNAFVYDKRFFICQKNGLAANDVLSWLDDTIIRKYLVCEVGSSLGTHLCYFAIPYENAATYE